MLTYDNCEVVVDLWLCHELVIKSVWKEPLIGRGTEHFQEHRGSDSRGITEMLGNKVIPLWKCVSWQGVRNGGAVVSLSASRSHGVRVKGNKMRGRGEGAGGEEAGGMHREEDHTWCSHASGTWWSARSANTSQEETKWKSWGRAAQPVPALTCVLTDVTTVGQNQTNVCVRQGGGGSILNVTSAVWTQLLFIIWVNTHTHGHIETVRLHQQYQTGHNVVDNSPWLFIPKYFKG